MDQNEPLASNASGGTALGPETVGQPFAQNFFLSGGAAPYTWSLASGQLPPGLTLRTTPGRRHGTIGPPALARDQSPAVARSRPPGPDWRVRLWPGGNRQGLACGFRPIRCRWRPVCKGVRRVGVPASLAPDVVRGRAGAASFREDARGA